MSHYELFSGILVGFIVLSSVGQGLSVQNPFQTYRRLHRYILPEAYFYPTASQLRAMLVEMADPDKVLVIVGGSSVMVGNGQGAHELWTLRLQEVLGDQFTVVNMAAPGGMGQEYGGVMAQVMADDGYKVVYVMDAGTRIFGPPDGIQYNHIFWDAYYKGLLPEHEERMEKFQRLASTRVRLWEFEYPERRLRAMLNTWLHFDEVWNTFGYTTLFTTWTFLVRQPVGYFWTPRKELDDPAATYQPDPVEQRYARLNVEQVMQTERRVPRDACSTDETGELFEDPTLPHLAAYEADARAAFPDEFRRRTVVSVTYHSPYFWPYLSEREQACADTAYAWAVAALERTGFRALTTGKDFGIEDYDDLVHLTASGGARLARVLAPEIRAKARQLGYLE